MRYWNNFFDTKSDSYAIKLLCLVAMITVAGISSIFYRQPASWYDEEIHYVRSIQISNGDILTTRNNDSTQYGGMVSKTQNTFIERAFSSKLFDETIQAIEFTWPSDYKDLRYSVEKEYKVAVTAVPYNPFSYLIYSAVVVVNRVLKLNVWTEFIFMRLFGFLISSLLILWSVRIIPFGKLILLLIVTLPPYFLGMSSVTSDSLLFGLVPLFIAYSLRFYYSLMQGSGLKSPELLKYLLIGLTITLLKPPAFIIIGLIVPLIFLGIKSKLLNKKVSILLTSSIILFAIITLGWQYIVKDVDTTKYFASVADSSKQIDSIISNPFSFLKILIRSVLKYNFIAIQLGYADSPYFMDLPFVPSFMASISIFMISWIDGLEKSIASLEWKLFNAYRLLIFSGLVFVTFVALYLQFTAVGATEIIGVQPRYFLPFWISILATPYIKIRVSNTLEFVLLFGALSPYFIYHIYVWLQL